MKTKKYLVIFLALASLSLYGSESPNDLETLWANIQESIGKGKQELAIIQLDSFYIKAMLQNDTMYLENYYETAGELAYYRKDYDECLRLSKANEKLLKDTDNYALQCLVKARIGNIQRHYGNIDSSYYFAYSAKALLPKIDFEKNSYPKIYVYNDLAMLHSETSQIDSSVFYYLEMLKITPSKDSFRLHQINLNISGAFKKLKNRKKQAYYLNQSWKYCQSPNLIGSRAKVISHQASFELDNGNIEKALELINSSIDLKIKNSKKTTLSDSYLIKSKILIARGEYQSAKEVLKLIDDFATTKNREDASDYFLSKLIIAIETNDDKSIPQLFKKTTEAVEALDFLANKKHLYFIGSKYYKKIGNHKLANELLEKYVSVNDSLTNFENIQIAKNLESEFEFEKSNLRIATLEKQELLSQKDLTRQRYLLLGGGAALGLISLLSFFLFGQNNKIKKQKEIIEKALSEKDTLLREIHHRVKNNLQLVSSLLTLQSRSITDQSAIAAINDGKARVRSMALIHQNLYSRENLTGISVDNYIDKLCEEIFNTYNIQNNRITLESNIQKIELDVDTVVPLGLIINELLSNSLKYAFPDERSGKISINLKKEKNQLILKISDNGVGMLETTFDKSTSFGNRLIKILTEQLDGTFTMSSSQGTQVEIVFDSIAKAA